MIQPRYSSIIIYPRYCKDLFSSACIKVSAIAPTMCTKDQRRSRQFLGSSPNLSTHVLLWQCKVIKERLLRNATPT